MDRQRFLLPMLALLTVWRLALLPTVELSPDEALALFYSKHLALWHLEMGPLTPWLIKLSTFVLGPSELGVRLFAPVLALITSVCFWRLCRGLFDATVAAWATLLLQVLPAFNITALYLNSGSVSMVCVLGFVMSLRAALHRASPWSRAWGGCALLLLLAMLADWRNAIAWVGVVIALGASKRRHHLWSLGFGVVTLAMLLGLTMLIRWNVHLDWPMFEASELEPVWQVWPNYLRWLILASPLFLVGFAWAARQCWVWRTLLHHDAVIMLTVGGLYALADFAWGPRERWPHVGLSWWMLPAIAVLAHQSIGTSASVRRKVALRSFAVLLAATQSMMLMRTDMLRRTMKLNWSFQTVLRESKTYREFYRTDPSSAMLGWRQGAEVVAGIVNSTSSKKAAPWFLIASSWTLATELDAYLPIDLLVIQPPEHPRVSVTLRTVRDQPLALFPRYDAITGNEQPYRGQRALFITDDTKHTPPPEIRNGFSRVEAISVVRIMHAGHEVRTLKIFACYDYQPPDL